jgi:hypothetical protein
MNGVMKRTQIAVIHIFAFSQWVVVTHGFESYNDM